MTLLQICRSILRLNFIVFGIILGPTEKKVDQQVFGVTRVTPGLTSRIHCSRDKTFHPSKRHQSIFMRARIFSS